MPTVRTGQTDVALSREAFERRIRERFYDPAFETVASQIDAIVKVAWGVYHEYRKSPRKRRAGPGFFDPEFELPVEWLDARQRIIDAETRQKQDDSTGDITFSAPSGNFRSEVSVSLGTTVGNARIRYTTNGRLLTASSPVYSELPCTRPPLNCGPRRSWAGPPPC